jgi:hypothetical protein
MGHNQHGRYVLDGNGNPLAEPDLMTWWRWLQTADRHVGKDIIGEALVSTVFLGIDHSFGGDVPILFETMIFGGRHDHWQTRYATREEALAGHNRAVALVEETDGSAAASREWDVPKSFP